jgi:hypothetical protein
MAKQTIARLLRSKEAFFPSFEDQAHSLWPAKDNSRIEDLMATTLMEKANVLALAVSFHEPISDNFGDNVDDDREGAISLIDAVADLEALFETIKARFKVPKMLVKRQKQANSLAFGKYEEAHGGFSYTDAPVRPGSQRIKLTSNLLYETFDPSK